MLPSTAYPGNYHRFHEGGISGFRFTAIALALTNLGTIAAVTGALVSTSIGYVLPSLMLGQTLASAHCRT